MRELSSPPAAFYTCPGERHAISRSVHLARLSAFYPACQACPHRCDTGLLPESVVVGWESAATGRTSQIRLIGDGLRGRYLNDLTRRDAQLWAMVVAAWLWDRRPLPGRCDDTPLTADRFPAGPTVVVGYDERPSSPDLAVGVVDGLRQMGCQVVDLGQTLKPVWQFAAGHLAADAGVFITGNGFDASWTGFDLLGSHAVPLDDAALWARWSIAVTMPISRPTRTPGTLRTWPVSTEYEATLWQHFHALRPFRVVCGATSPLMERLLARVFPRTPCQYHGVRLLQPRTEDAVFGTAAALRQAVSEHQADIAVGFGVDGQSLMVMDERGEVIPAAEWLPWLITRTLVEHSQCHAVVAHAAIEQASGLALARTIVDGGATEFVRHLNMSTALCGVDAALRFWWADPSPTCDALVTLAALLRAASWSGDPLSKQLA
ncbi:MAG: hypothetical protein Q8K78_12525 [Planctomycetaceae bacterium]|nr:hypothetical protein [Planctomycetaceae bacterium]